MSGPDASTRVFADPYLYIEGWGTRRGLLPCSICGAVTVLGDPDTTDAHIRYHLDRGDLDD